MAGAKEVNFHEQRGSGNGTVECWFHSPALPGTVPIRLDFENLLLPGSWRQEESNVPDLENST